MECAERFYPSLRTSANSAVSIELNPAPIHLHAVLPPPSRLHSARVPLLLCSDRSCGVGAGTGFSIVLAGFGCEVGMDAWLGVCRWGFCLKTINNN